MASPRSCLLTAAATMLACLPAMAVDVTHYDLDLSLEPEGLNLDAVATLTVGPGAQAPLSALNLDLIGFAVDSITWNGADVSYSYEGDGLVITPPAPLTEGESATVAITYHGVPTPYVTEQGELGIMQEREVTFAINVTEGARHWFPSNDRLDDKASVDLKLTLPRGYESAGPGHLKSITDLGANRQQHHWQMSQEVTPYLLSFAFSPRYQRQRLSLQTLYGPVDADIALLPATWDTADTALSQLEPMIAWLTQRYGPFPYDQVAFHEIPFPGAVEQPGNIAMGSFYFADDPRLQAYFAHELSHTWFQGVVTIRTWGDVWLSEGAAAWHEILWAEEADGLAAADAQAAVYIDAYRVGMLDEGSFPLADPNLVFGFTTYMKGPVVWRLLEHLAGRDALNAVLSAYLADADGVADLDDFFAHLSGLSAPGLARFYDEWMARAGLPDYRFGYELGPSEGKVGLVMQLSQPVTDIYTTPVDVHLAYADGREEIVTLRPTSGDDITYLCLDEAPTTVTFDPRRMVPAARPAALSRLQGTAAEACLVDPPDPGGCESRSASGWLPALSLFFIPMFCRRRR